MLRNHQDRCYVNVFEDFSADPDAGKLNIYGSPVFHLLNVVNTFGMMREISNMVRLGHVWSKYVWKKRIWERAWDLDKCHWRTQVRCHHNLDHMSNIIEFP